MKPIQTASLSLALGLFAGLAAASNRASDPPQAPVKLSGTWKLNKDLSDDPAQKMRELRSASGSERGGGGGGMGGHGGGGMGGHGGGGGGGMGGRCGGGYGGGRGGGGQRAGGGSGTSGEQHRGGSGFMGGEPPLDGGAGEDRPNGQSQPGQGTDPGAGGPPPDQEAHSQRRPTLAPSPQFAIEQEDNVMVFRTPANLRLVNSDGEKQKKEDAAGKVEVTAKFLKGSLVIETKAETGGKRKETYTILQDGKLQADFDFEGFGQMPALKFKLIYDAAPAPQL